MIYGDPSYQGAIAWLSEGTRQIPGWRYALAMGLAFPAIIFYGIAWFAIQELIPKGRWRSAVTILRFLACCPGCVFTCFTSFLYGFSWMNTNGYATQALPVSEAVFFQFAWLVPVSEIMMLPPYFYWLFAAATGRSILPKWMALSNPLIFYALLKLITLFMPAAAFRLAFVKGLMSESMLIWFISLLVWMHQPPKANHSHR